MHKLPRLYKSRHGVYYLRIIRNKQKYRWSLGTKDFKQARIHALDLNMKLAMNDFDPSNSNIKKLDVEITPSGTVNFKDVKSGDIDIVSQIIEKLGLTPAQFSQLSPAELASKLASSPQPPSMGELIKSVPKGIVQGQRATQKSELFSTVVNLYLTEKKIDNVAKTLYDKERVYDEFKGFFGDLDINQYTPNEAVAYKNRLLAANGSASAINAKTSFLRSLFEYAINNNLFFAGNPFERVKISTKAKLKKQVRSYKPFEDDDLKLIFEELKYRAFLKKPDYHWLPFLSLYTGARVEELASLRLDQITKVDGILVFDIQHDAAKNSNSVRKIPLPDVILNSKFLSYVEQVKATKATHLFPHLKDGKNGFSKNMSRRFGEYLDKLEIKDDRKVFHSFRTTFINSMTNLHVHPAILMAIVGHYEQAKVDFSSPHFANYQQDKPMKVLKDAMDKLSYPIKNFH
ncbi:TPA: tyrosine-type recombinase/integrase [Burkholderia vietnamiensis]|uniref:site-specific integrase n=1 Tax=Burkholderia vietnamiensis TaxID=60552 RepID=UPI0009C037CE|nr:site-specific integrase [Burkholderia vietnamiensis]MCA8194653.1 site-specific integrase [Burkholderia vietnamiensis]MCA8206566.1 site-specific integrase [Burkholderia vietnamiensis]MCA8227096.1 site-specific integrase [Burkholderia vietnamiensis]MCA8286530.1 site-specific integrase [Burkholderia vietnamiensis]HDR9098766.1 tyrosine-type recombinase/integrase [Burkholderia vietnamiensis]